MVRVENRKEGSNREMVETFLVLAFVDWSIILFVILQTERVYRLR